jgi:hypothetical protein
MLPGGGSACLAVAITGGTCAGSCCASIVAGSGLPSKTEAERKGRGPAAGWKGCGPTGQSDPGSTAGRKGRGPAGTCCSTVSRLLFKCHGASSRFHRIGGDGVLSRTRFFEGRDAGGADALLAPLVVMILCLSFARSSSMSLWSRCGEAVTDRYGRRL